MNFSVNIHLNQMLENGCCADTLNRELALEADNAGRAAFAYNGQYHDACTVVTTHDANRNGLEVALSAALERFPNHPVVNARHLLRRIVPLNHAAVCEMIKAHRDHGIEENYSCAALADKVMVQRIMATSANSGHGRLGFGH